MLERIYPQEAFKSFDQIPVLSLVFDDSVVTVNRRYELRPNGSISFNRNGTNEITEHKAGCAIQVLNNSDIFQVRLNICKCDDFYVFTVYPVGPVLVDPMHKAAEESVAKQKAEAGTSTSDDGEADIQIEPII